ncbi:MAG: response regulator protein [Deltaproteobacteria bacterium HGW-Deltaproteobacteria-15]|jgi:signal transduction histidine kinase|nr:MAG: response regulator protein [Deltaproteobacteria bacterium HGW-Deltaproteobacteria-15]
MDQLAGVEAFYRIFRDISTSVHTSSDIKEVLDLVVRKSTEVVNAKGAVLRILNLDTNELELSAACGLSERYLSKGHVSSGKIITELCRLNKVIIVDDVQTSPRVQYPREARDEGIKSMLDLPLTIRDHVVGIIRVFFMEHRRFTEEQLDFLTGIAEQCSLAIDKARLIENQRYRYHQLAIQTEKLSALGRMAAGVAHEVNNPLAGILLYSTNLVKKVPREGPLREGLQIIISETMRCKQIIQDLLEFSRDKPPEKVMASVNQMIEKALAILENEFHLKHILIQKDLSREIPDILLDGGQIQQVLVNLLINASESIGDHGTITIRSRTEPEWVRVEIEDTGCGIAPEHMAKIFEPFFSTKTKGTGLGLAVSFGIIQNHQGNIGATSQMGKGSCFTVDLPIIANP